MCSLFFDLFVASILFIFLLTPVLQFDRSIPTLVVANELDFGGKLSFELRIKRIDNPLKRLFLLGVVCVSLEQSFVNRD